MTINTVFFFYGFPMTWREFSKVFLKKDIDDKYISKGSGKWKYFEGSKPEFFDEIEEDVFNVIDSASELTKSIEVMKYPHDLVEHIDSLDKKDDCVMVGVLVDSFDVPDDDDDEDIDDGGVTTRLHRPLFMYHYMPEHHRIAEAKAKWDEEIGGLNATFKQKPRLYKLADDCACCS